MVNLNDLTNKINAKLTGLIDSISVINDEITVEVTAQHIKNVLLQLRNDKTFAFNQLMDLCAVDYLTFGKYDWETDSATEHGFSRGVNRQQEKSQNFSKPRFAVVYHLLSIEHNHRMRVKVFLDETNVVIPSVNEIWKVANWYEREAYDLYGILFEGHPDLRRILTDYGFIGHPFRKDFPLGGEVEMRYDASLQKVIYEPVDLEPRVTVPKVVRNDNRYLYRNQPKVDHD